MSANRHTPGLLFVTKNKHGASGYVVAVVANERGDRSLLIEAPDGDDSQADANARRLVACWNACQRFETDLLERVSRPGSYGIHPAPQDRIDELLVALEMARRLLKMTSVYTAGEMSDIDASIAKVKGGVT